jgi:hypothetical protein
MDVKCGGCGVSAQPAEACSKLLLFLDLDVLICEKYDAAVRDECGKVLQEFVQVRGCENGG